MAHNFALYAIVMFWIISNIVPISCVNLMSGRKLEPELRPEMLWPIVSASSGCFKTCVCTCCSCRICSHICDSGLKSREDSLFTLCSGLGCGLFMSLFFCRILVQLIYRRYFPVLSRMQIAYLA